MKRLFDFSLSLFLLALGGLPLGGLCLLLKLSSRGPLFYWSDRIGRNNRIFRMPKFRTMRIETPEVASHLLVDPEQWLTPLGGILRRTSLDEVPQLWSVLVGDMSFVGPRPALHNQDDLIALRTLRGVHKLTPGVTGWAQVNGRDETPIPQKVSQDTYYLENRSFWFDLKIIGMTFMQVVRRKGTCVPSDICGVDQGHGIPCEAYIASAATWFQLREYDRAISAYNSAIRLGGNSDLVLNNRGAAWAAKGEFEKAIADFSDAIRFDQSLAVAYRNRAFAWTEMAELQKAQDDLRMAGELATQPDITNIDSPSLYSAFLVLEHDQDDIGWKWMEMSPSIEASCLPSASISRPV